MLRITIHEVPGSVTFQLEGKLKGPWVQELVECWRKVRASQQGPAAYLVDLSGVTFVDATGKSFLATAHSQGARFIASDCLTKAIVAEITQPQPAPNQAARQLP